MALLRPQEDDQLYNAVHFTVNRATGALYLDETVYTLTPEALTQRLKSLEDFPQQVIFLQHSHLHQESLTSIQVLAARHNVSCIPVSGADQVSRFLLALAQEGSSPPRPPTAPDLDAMAVDAVKQIPGLGRVSAQEALLASKSIASLAQEPQGSSSAKREAINDFFE